MGRAVKYLYLISAAWLCVSATPATLDFPQALHYAQSELVHVGPLEAAPNGLVYIKVPDSYIHETLRLLNRPDIAPPDYFGEGKIGAHITVITPQESSTRQLFLPQLHQPVVFTVLELACVEVNGKQIYYFKVDAPQIELIRLSNGLPPKIQNHDFHITIGVSNK